MGKAMLVEIQDNQMLQIGKRLQCVHISIVMISFLTFIVGIVVYVMLNDALVKLQEDFNMGLSVDPMFILGPLIPGIIASLACTLWVWNSTKTNDKSSFRCICIGECTFVAVAIIEMIALTVLTLILSGLRGLLSLQRESCDAILADNLYTPQSEQDLYHNELNVRQGNPYQGLDEDTKQGLYQECHDHVSTVDGPLAIVQNLFIVLVIIQLLQAIFCGLGCMKANEARSCLENGKVFVGEAVSAPAVILGNVQPAEKHVAVVSQEVNP